MSREARSPRGRYYIFEPSEYPDINGYIIREVVILPDEKEGPTKLWARESVYPDAIVATREELLATKDGERALLEWEYRDDTWPWLAPSPFGCVRQTERTSGSSPLSPEEQKAETLRRAVVTLVPSQQCSNRPRVATRAFVMASSGEGCGNR